MEAVRALLIAGLLAACLLAAAPPGAAGGMLQAGVVDLRLATCAACGEAAAPDSQAMELSATLSELLRMGDVAIRSVGPGWSAEDLADLDALWIDCSAGSNGDAAVGADLPADLAPLQSFVKQGGSLLLTCNSAGGSACNKILAAVGSAVRVGGAVANEAGEAAVIALVNVAVADLWVEMGPDFGRLTLEMAAGLALPARGAQTILRSEPGRPAEVYGSLEKVGGHVAVVSGKLLPASGDATGENATFAAAMLAWLAEQAHGVKSRN